MIKKHILISLLILILIIIGFSIYKVKSIPKITQEDRKQIFEITNNYYTALEHQDFSALLSFLYFPKEVSGNMDNELQHREIALKEISKNINYRIALQTVVTSNGESVVYQSPDRKYVIMIVVSINYKQCTGGSVQEKLVFDKVSGQWKIIKIYSSDRYIPLRASEYTYWKALDPLLPME